MEIHCSSLPFYFSVLLRCISHTFHPFEVHSLMAFSAVAEFSTFTTVNLRVFSLLFKETLPLAEPPSVPPFLPDLSNH